MDTSEALYLRTETGWENLGPRLLASPYEVPIAPSWPWHTPCVAMDALLIRHPRARVTPPFREVVCVLKGRDTPNPRQEVTAALDSGFFVGFVYWTRTDTGVAMRVREAGFLLPSYCTETYLHPRPTRFPLIDADS